MNTATMSEMLKRIDDKMQSDIRSVESTLEFFQSFSDIVQECLQGLSKANHLLTYQSATQEENSQLSLLVQPFIGLLTGMISNFCLLVQQTDTEIISPLSSFKANMESSVATIMESSVEKQKEFSEAKISLTEAKHNYFEAVERSKSNDNSIHDQMFRSAKDRYLGRIQEVNKLSELLFADIHKNIKMLDDIEETRVNFLHVIHGKFFKLSQDLLKKFTHNPKREECKVLSNYIKDSSLATVLKYSQSLKEEFIDYKRYEYCPKFIDVYLSSLIDEGNLINFSMFQEMIEDKKFLKMFFRYLFFRIGSPELKVPVVCYLSILYIDILNSDIPKDSESFHYFLSTSCAFYCMINGNKAYLIDFILNIHLLQNKSTWIQAIEKRVNLLISKESTSIFMNTADKMKRQKLAYLVCYEYRNFILKAELSLEMTTDIILEICNKVKLDNQRIGNLLTEFIVLLKPPIKMNTCKKNIQRAQRWGYLLPIAHSLQYLEWKDLKNVLLVCKNWNLAFKTKTTRLELIRLDTYSEFNNPLRQHLWAKILITNPVNYSEILRNMNEETIANYINVINHDIQRSYRYEDRVSPTIQKNILSAIAQSFASVGYCQGMNYLSGFLYMNFQNEADTYNAFVGLLKNMKMEHCLDKELSNSIVMFYKIDRLVSVLLPEVHQLLAENGISAIYYASPWILTVFVYVLQKRPRILLKIWDYFLAKGSKALVKMTILVLSLKKPEFLSNSNELFIRILTEFNNNLLDQLECDLIGQLESIPISNKVLRDLEGEFYEVNMISSS